MTARVRHSKVSGGVVNPSVEVDGADWNADHVITGLENVDNTSDVNKPVSTATQAALDLKANLSSPTFTGDPKAPTAAADDNDTSIATTAFVLGQAGSATPIVNGTGAAGTSPRYSRQDHVHPTDTSRAPLASPPLTGTPTAPTASVDTNTTQIATTAYVVGQAAAATPLGNAATAVVGVSTRFARADHVHPGREVLTAARTYYVRADGSDSNNGLANTSGGAFLTIQKAVTTVYTLDLSIYDVTIQVAAGTYTGTILANTPFVGAGKVFIIGDTTTPTNVVLSTTGDTLTAARGSRLYVSGFKFVSSSGSAVTAAIAGYVQINGKVEFGTCGSRHISSVVYGEVESTADYTISGGAGAHYIAESLGYIVKVGGTVTLTGTPAFSTAFAYADTSLVVIVGTTFSGSATGVRYTGGRNSVFRTGGAGGSYFPGNVAGTPTAGGADASLYS